MWVIKYDRNKDLVHGGGIWTVGYHNPQGEWEPHRDFSTQDDAARYVHWLNGGNSLEAFKE